MLRSTLVGAVTVSLLAHPAVAQRARPHFGIDIGASLATATDTDTPGAKTKVGPYYGLSAIIQPPTGMVGLQTGLYYVSRGSKYEDPDVSATLKLGYVELPVMLRISPVTKAGGSVPALFAGASFALRTGCKLESGSVSIDCDDGIADANLKRFDFGVTIGGEVAIPIGPRAFIVPSARFTQGLTSVSSDADASGKNRTIQLGVGLRRHR